MRIKFKYVGILIIAVLVMTITSSSLVVAVGGMTIGGCIYTGDGTVTYTPVGPEIESTYNTIYAADGATPITDAQVMVQNQHSGGAFITYGSLGPTGSNPYAHCWEATIPDTDGDGTPDATDLIVMFSAPGHNLTSREFTWDDGRFGLGGFVHPTGPDVAAGGTGAISVLAAGPQDAYLPPLDANGELPTANLLHYVFYDNFVNGNDNGPIIDPPLNGVTVRVFDEDGAFVAEQVTGALAFSQGGFVTVDGLPMLGEMAYGAVYFTGLPGGKEFKVVSDPTTVTQADNPHFTLKMDHTNDACSTDVYGYNNTDCNWYQTYTEEGGHAWEVYAWPGWAGTEMGGYATWHGFTEKMDSDAGCVPSSGICGSISGAVIDADGNDPQEPFVTMMGGRVPFGNNSRYEDGFPWDVTRSAAGWGGTPDPNGIATDVIPNSRIPDVIVALYTAGGDTRQLVATTEATGIAYYNDPNGTEFTFTNVPPGQYEMFTFDKDLVNVPMIGNGVFVAPGQNSVITILMPRFMARAMGFVMNMDTPGPDGYGVPVPGATVKVTYGTGSAKHTAATNANGWFLHDGLPETGVPGYVYLDLQDGDTIRGKIITEQFQKWDATLPICVPTPPATTCPNLADPANPIPPNPAYSFATHNAMNRIVMWWTLNYFVDIQVETIPAGVGNLMGVVFNDNLAMGAWVGDGVRNDAEEAMLPGQTVELYPAPGGVCDTGATPVTATTGEYNEADAEAIGMPPYWPYNETGGVFAGPVTFDGADPAAPAVGFYEFRDVLPGDYCVQVAPSAGFQASDADVGPDGFEHVTVTDGRNNRVDLGLSTTPAGAAWGVPMAGEIEGGVFSGLGNLDPNPGSLLFEEAAGIVNSPVGVYDHYNYLLGAVFQPDPNCHPANNVNHTPGDPNDPFACSSTVETSQSAEFERRFAPGVHRYIGNDPAFPDSNIPVSSNPLDGFVQGYDPAFDLMELGYSFAQAGSKAEAAWTPIAPLTGGPTADMCAISLTSTSFTSEPWGANVTVTVSDGYTWLAGAQVMASVDGQGQDCITNGAGQCSINFEKFEGAGASVTFNVDTITVNNQPWYVYNPNTGGILAGACQTSLDIYEPGATPPPPPTYQCSDGADNDGDGLIDHPADPGCVSPTDDNEADDPPPPPAPQCLNGLDDDGDGFIDWPADPGCVDAADDDEYDAPPPLPQCSDWIDNDGDGLIDMADPGCTSVTDDDETDPPAPQCSDGLDNDGDLLTDFPDDPGCTDAADDDETDPPPAPQCSDGIDNDGDGLIDMADPGCTSVTDSDETDPVGGPNPASVHVVDLDGADAYKEGKLSAIVTVTIADDLGNLVDGATVNFSYTWMKEGKPTTKSMSCVTDATGMCTAQTKWMENTSSVDVSVDNVTDATGLVYHPQDNTDPDGDSDGTTITIP